MPSRDLPNLALKGFFDLGEDGWDDEMSLNLLKLSVLVQATALDKVAADPGAPVDGDVYIFDETHATHPNEVAIRDDGAWVYVEPFEGWLIFNQAAGYYEKFDGTVWAELATGGGGGSGKYRIGFSIENEEPGANEVLLRHVFTDAVDFADDFAGSVGDHGGSNPATDQTFSIVHNGSAVGSVVLSSAGAVTFATTGGALSVAAGDELRVEAPAVPDANTVGFAVTLYGVEA